MAGMATLEMSSMSTTWSSSFAESPAHGLDPKCETFVPAEEFCWNCEPLEEGFDYKGYRCLGHAVGDPEEGAHTFRYADDTVGRLRQQSESLFLLLKQEARELKGRPAEDGRVCSFGIGRDTYHACAEELGRLRDAALGFYWSHSKEPRLAYAYTRGPLPFCWKMQRWPAFGMHERVRHSARVQRPARSGRCNGTSGLYRPGSTSLRNLPVESCTHAHRALC